MASKPEFETGSLLYGLSPEYNDLLDRVCDYCSSGKRISDPENIDGKFLKNWEGQVFHDFILNHKDLVDAHKQGIEKHTPVSYHTFDVSKSGGMKPKSARAVFCFSAQIYGVSVEEHLKNFVQYCEVSETFKHPKYEIHNYQHRAFKNEAHTINKLLNEGSKTPSPQHSPQDYIAVDAEIEKIKRDLKFYPFVKDQIRIKNSKSEYSTALSKIEKLLLISPENIELSALKVTILILLKQKDEALDLAKYLYEEHREDEYAMNSYSAVLSSFGKFKKALSVARKAREVNKLALSISLNIGMFLERLGRFEDAIKEYKYTIELDKDYLKPYYRVSLCYAWLDQFEKSEAAINAAIRIAPNNRDVLTQWVKIKNHQGQTEAIAEKITEYISSKEHGVEEKYFAASLALFSDDVGGAEKIMRKIVNDVEFNLFETNSGKSQAYSLLATVLHESGLSDKKHQDYALECYLKSLSLDPKNHAALEGLGEISYLSGDVETAKKNLEQVSNLYDEYTAFGKYGWEVYIQLSIVAKGQKLEYLEPLLWCIERYKNNIECRLYLAREYIELDNVADSKHHIDIALNIFDEVIDEAELSIREARSCGDLGNLIVCFERAVHQELGFLPKALEIFEKLSTDLTKDRDLSLWRDVMYNKAEVLRLLGADAQDVNVSKKAICTFEKLIESCPSFEYQELCDDIQSKIDGIKLGKISS